MAFASSLGAEDQVLTHMIATAGLDIPIFTLDTGRLYPETYDLPGPHGQALRPVHQDVLPRRRRGREDGRQRTAWNLFRDSHFEARHRCCEVRKILPLRRAQLELGAWICGLRSGQGMTRQKVEFAGVGPAKPTWSRSTRWARGTRRACGTTSVPNDVPYNPLHDQGFPSIGCAPCTRARAVNHHRSDQ